MPDNEFTGLSQIRQIAITIQDLDRAVKFYRDTLGMRFLFQAPPSLAFFDCGGIRLMLSPPDKPGEHYSSILYYKVDNIQEAHRALLSRGVEFGSAPHMIAKLPDHDLWLADFRDSEGNLLALMSEVRER